MFLLDLPYELVSIVVDSLQLQEFENLALAGPDTYALLSPFLARHTECLRSWQRVACRQRKKLWMPESRGADSRPQINLGKHRVREVTTAVEFLLEISLNPRVASCSTQLDLSDRPLDSNMEEFLHMFGNSTKIKLDSRRGRAYLALLTSLLERSQHLKLLQGEASSLQQWVDLLTTTEDPFYQADDAAYPDSLTVLLVSFLPNLQILSLPDHWDFFTGSEGWLAGSPPASELLQLLVKRARDPTLPQPQPLSKLI